MLRLRLGGRGRERLSFSGYLGKGKKEQQEGRWGSLYQ